MRWRGHLHGREASSEVWRLADDPEPDVRLALIQAAPAVATEPEALLLYMTTDPDRSVQDSARNRLQRWQVGGRGDGGTMSATIGRV